MFAENKEMFSKCNLLEWHEAGYTGKGIRAAVWDDLPYIDTDMAYAHSPILYSVEKPTHATWVAKCLHEAAPDAEIFMLPCNRNVEITVKWILENQIDIISCSTSTKREKESDFPYNILKSCDIPFFIAAGNEDREISGLPAFDWTISVGAATNKGVKEDYSNYGDTMDCFSYIPQINAYGIVTKFNGTSFAQPFVAGMFACYAQWLKENGEKCGKIAAKSFVSQCDKGVMKMPELPQKEELAMSVIQYQYPFKSTFVLGTPYGQKGSLWKCGWHSGQDFKSTNYGGNGKVYPVAEGTVTLVANSSSYGNHVIISHKDGYVSLYAHLAKVYVVQGQPVSLSTFIGQEGSTGNSTGTHLHLEIHKNKYSYPSNIDPIQHIENMILEVEKMEKAEIERIVAERIEDFKKSLVSKTKIKLCGKVIDVDTIVKDGNNYIKLRDLICSEIGVDYDAKNKLAEVFTK